MEDVDEEEYLRNVAKERCQQLMSQNDKELCKQLMSQSQKDLPSDVPRRSSDFLHLLPKIFLPI